MLEIIGSTGQSKGAPAFFVGEVRAASFITTSTLSSAVGLRDGTSNGDAIPWLQFNDNGKTYYVAKKALRYGLSWNNLNDLGLNGRSVTVKIGIRTFIVRNMTGSTADPGKLVGGEYDHFLAQMAKDSPKALPGAPYSWNDFLISGTAKTYGDFTICKEKGIPPPQGFQWGIRRWKDTITQDVVSNSDASAGWRPILELVS